MKTKLIAGLITMFILCSTGAFAQTTYLVDQGGGGDFTTIQDCIDTVVNGDTCQVNAATYVENIDFSGKDITVVSTSGPNLTLINGNASGSVVTFSSGETQSSVLDGFTLSGGSGTLDYGGTHGGGIFITNASSPTISNCRILNNTVTNRGGASKSNWVHLQLLLTAILKTISLLRVEEFAANHRHRPQLRTVI